MAGESGVKPGSSTSTGFAANVPGAGPSGASGDFGAQILTDAAKYLGVPYRWGGADPSGFDCSGFVTWVLHHDLGLNLPDNTHTVTGTFLYWSGALTVKSPLPGDLCCWGGHIGIYAGNGKMINAPHTGTVVQYSTVWTGVVYRRVLPQTVKFSDVPGTKKAGTAF